MGHIIKQKKVIEEHVTETALVKFCDLENNVFCYTEVEFTKDSPYFIELDHHVWITMFYTNYRHGIHNFKIYMFKYGS